MMIVRLNMIAHHCVAVLGRERIARGESVTVQIPPTR